MKNKLLSVYYLHSSRLYYVLVVIGFFSFIVTALIAFIQHNRELYNDDNQDAYNNFIRVVSVTPSRLEPSHYDVTLKVQQLVDTNFDTTLIVYMGQIKYYQNNTDNNNNNNNIENKQDNKQHLLPYNMECYVNDLYPKRGWLMNWIFGHSTYDVYNTVKFSAPASSRYKFYFDETSPGGAAPRTREFTITSNGSLILFGPDKDMCDDYCNNKISLSPSPSISLATGKIVATFNVTVDIKYGLEKPPIMFSAKLLNSAGIVIKEFRFVIVTVGGSGITKFEEQISSEIEEQGQYTLNAKLGSVEDTNYFASMFYGARASHIYDIRIK